MLGAFLLSASIHSYLSWLCNWLFVLLLFIYFKIYLFIYLFLAVLGLRFCARAFSSCGEGATLHRSARASPVADHRLQTRRLSSCGSRA